MQSFPHLLAATPHPPFLFAEFWDRQRGRALYTLPYSRTQEHLQWPLWQLPEHKLGCVRLPDTFTSSLGVYKWNKGYLHIQGTWFPNQKWYQCTRLRDSHAEAKTNTRARDSTCLQPQIYKISDIPKEVICLLGGEFWAAGHPLQAQEEVLRPSVAAFGCRGNSSTKAAVQQYKRGKLGESLVNGFLLFIISLRVMSAVRHSAKYYYH